MYGYVPARSAFENIMATNDSCKGNFNNIMVNGRFLAVNGAKNKRKAPYVLIKNGNFLKNFRIY